MCQLFHTLKEVAIKYFPGIFFRYFDIYFEMIYFILIFFKFFFLENKEIKYSVVSGFIFLRFFAPAILGPRLFDLTKEQIVCFNYLIGVFSFI